MSHWKLEDHFPSEFDLTIRISPNQIVGLPGRDEKIEAVKLYRELFGSGLQEAEEAVERIGEQNGIYPHQDQAVSGLFFCEL